MVNVLLFLQNGLLTESGLRGAFLITAIGSLLLAASFSAIMFWFFSVLFVLSYTYSVPPLRLKDRPFWGFFVNAFGFGFLIPITVIPNMGAHCLAQFNWILPLYFFLSIGAIYCVTTLPDIEGDRTTGKKTIAVVFPRYPYYCWCPVDPSDSRLLAIQQLCSISDKTGKTCSAL